MDGNHPDPWSATKEDLFAAMRGFRSTDTPVVATIVAVEGSAYRRPGAKMIVDPESESIGAITAGCLEGPVADLASDVLEAGTPTVHTFDLIDDEGWGLGLGCHGIIDILLEPLDDSWEAALDELAARRPVAIVTAVSTDGEIDVGDRVVLDEDGAVLTTAARGGLPETVVDAVGETRETLRANSSAATVNVETEDGSVEVFVDWVSPAPDLLLFGNQNDIQPVARIGRQAGFRVIVASARGGRSDSEHFPDAHEVRTAKATELADVPDRPDRTYAVIMSHNALEDGVALDSLLDTEVPYIGLLGPHERFDEIREDLAEQDGRVLTESELDRIATPVGLDLGGDEPAQIALSIVAEALAVHNGRDGGRLEDRAGPIHERLTASD